MPWIAMRPRREAMGVFITVDCVIFYQAREIEIYNYCLVQAVDFGGLPFHDSRVYYAGWKEAFQFACIGNVIRWISTLVHDVRMLVSDRMATRHDASQVG